MKKTTLIVMILIGLIGCSDKGKNEKQNNKDKEPIISIETPKAVNNDEEVIDRSKIDYTPLENGETVTVTTDGTLHEDELLNKTYNYLDTSDSFKIEKNSQGYFITNYDYDEEEDDAPLIERKERLKVYNNSILVGKDYGYAYDTKFKLVAVIDPETMTIIKLAETPWIKQD